MSDLACSFRMSFLGMSQSPLWEERCTYFRFREKKVFEIHKLNCVSEFEEVNLDLGPSEGLFHLQ